MLGKYGIFTFILYYAIIILVNTHDMKHSHRIPKTILLVLGILFMLPIATSWQNLFGSVHKSVGYSITEESAINEKQRMEEEMQKMQIQMQKLTVLIEQLDHAEASE